MTVRRFRIERDADGLPERLVWIGVYYDTAIPLATQTPDGLPRCLHVEDRVQCSGVGVYRDKRGRAWCGQHRRRKM